MSGKRDVTLSAAKGPELYEGAVHSATPRFRLLRYAQDDTFSRSPLTLVLAPLTFFYPVAPNPAAIVLIDNSNAESCSSWARSPPDSRNRRNNSICWRLT